MADRKDLQILNIIGFIIVLSVNIAANTVPINNKTTGEVSDMFPNLFAPAGFTFAIWGVIYLALLAFIVYQSRDLIRPDKKKMPFLKKIGFLFFISSILNAGWIFAWHYLQIGLSLVIMIALLLVLIKIYLNLEIGLKTVPSKERLWVNLPFRLYLGWIIIATIANVTAFLVDLGWDGSGLSEVFWTVVMIAAATVLTVLFLKYRKDLAVSLVSMWALLGITVKRLTTEPVETTVVISSIAAIFIIAFFSVWLIIKTINGRRKAT